MDNRYNNKIKSAIIFLIAVIFAIYFMMLAGCSTEKQINYHNKQAARHVQKAINKGYKVRADTVYILDTLLLTETRTDSIFISNPYDTIIIEKERLKVKYMRLGGDSVFIEGTCEADTVIKRIPYTVQERVYIEKTFFDYIGIDTIWKQIIFWVLIALIIAIFLWRLIKP